MRLVVYVLFWFLCWGLLSFVLFLVLFLILSLFYDEDNDHADQRQRRSFAMT